jgi:uncharacterized Tic20 family protein
MSLSDEIERLQKLKESGALSEEDFEKAKKSLLEKSQSEAEKAKATADPINSETNTWSVLIHLSQFCGYFIPLAGLIVPIVLWQIKKDELPGIDKHGRIVANWVFTEIIFFIIFFVLIFVLIGIPLMIALGIVGIVFPIVGAVKASNREVWPYPCSIRFFNLN